MVDTGLCHYHPPARLDVLPPPPSPTYGSQPGEWIPKVDWVPQAQPAPATGLADLGLSDSAIHALAAALQGVVVAGVTVALPSPVPSGPTGKVATLSLLHLHFSCGVAVDVDLPPILESVAWGRGKMDRLATLNQALMRGLPSCHRVFGGRAPFSASLPLLAFVKNVSLLNPSLDPACTGGGFTPWLTRQGSVEASTRRGADSALLAQQLYGRLA